MIFAILKSHSLWAVVDIALRGLVMLSIVLGLTAALRRAAASTRHLILTAGLASLLFLPVLSRTLPAWNLRLLPTEALAAFDATGNLGDRGNPTPIPHRVDGSGSLAQPRDPMPASPLAPLSPLSPLSIVTGRLERSRQATPTGPTASAGPTSSPAAGRQIAGWSANAENPEALAENSDGTATAAATVTQEFNWQRMLTASLSRIGASWPFLLWVSVSFLILLRLLIGISRIWLYTLQANEIVSGDWSDEAALISARLGLRRKVRVLAGAVAVPMTWGWLRPVILLPYEALDWPADRRRAVLSHEMAHSRRRDWITQTMGGLVCAVYWFNPLAWIALNRMRIEGERASDDQVLSFGARPSDYADHLLAIFRLLKGRAALADAAVTMARRSQLECRLMAILDPQQTRRRLGRGSRVLVVTALILILVPLAAMRPQARVRAAAGRGPVAPESNSDLGSSSEMARVQPPIQPPIQPAVQPWMVVENQSASAAQFPGAPGAVPGMVAAPPPSSELADLDQEGPFNDREAEKQEDKDKQKAKDKDKSGKDVDSDEQRAARQDNGPAIQALREALKDSDPQVRREAVTALARTGDPAATEYLIGEADDKDPRIRAAAIRALATQSARKAGRDPVPVLLKAIKDENPSVRREAAWGLGLRGDERAVDALIQATKDRDPQVQSQAVWALGLKGNDRAVDALIAATRSENRQVRSQAVWALGLKGNARSVEPLGLALRDADPEIRSQAAWALGLKGDSRAVEPLIQALKDSSPQVRSQAAWALGLKRDPRAVEPLKTLLKDENVQVRRQAAWAVGMIMTGYRSSAGQRSGEAAPGGAWPEHHGPR